MIQLLWVNFVRIEIRQLSEWIKECSGALNDIPSRVTSGETGNRLLVELVRRILAGQGNCILRSAKTSREVEWSLKGDIKSSFIPSDHKCTTDERTSVWEFGMVVISS